MTTPANNGPNGGANTPEDDDPFGYLYADGQAAGATPPGQGGGYGYPGQVGAAQPGVPRTSYNQVRTVGERTYGGQRGHVPPQHGAPPQHPQGGYQPPQPQYPAPETLAAGGYGVPQQQYAPPAPPQRGSGRRGLLIGAVAVVGAVVIGISVAIISSKGDEKDKDPAAGSGGQVSEAPETPGGESPKPDPSKKPQNELPKADAAAGPGVALAGGAQVQSGIKGAESANGQYVGGFNAVGASLTWTTDVAKAGRYRLYLRYATPGEDADATLTANGQANTTPLRLKNYGNTEKGSWEKGWKSTWGEVTLNEGTNSLKISCEQGNSCNAILDRVWIAPLG
jgi:hypothetical protein